MRAVVADLALELEAQVALVFRLARVAAAVDKGETAYARLLTPAVKFLVCKSTPQVVYESLECLGGNGYTEDLPMARLYPRGAAQRDLGRLGQRHGARRAARRRPPSRRGDGDASARWPARRRQAFDVRPLAEALENDAASPPDAERRARFLCEGLASIAALAALAEAKSRLCNALRRRAARRSRTSRSSARPISAAPRQALMDRALAA